MLATEETEASLRAVFPDIPWTSKSEYLWGDGTFDGIGIEKIVSSENIGEAVFPELESNPFRLKIILLISVDLDF